MFTATAPDFTPAVFTAATLGLMGLVFIHLDSDQTATFYARTITFSQGINCRVVPQNEDTDR